MAAGIAFEVAGKVEAKGRGRVGARIVSKATGKSFTPVFTPAHTRKYESLVRHAAGEAMGDREPFTIPVEIIIDVYLAIPGSKDRKFAKFGTDLKPDTKPDIDNYVKAALDAINTIIITDDKLVWCVTAKKHFSKRPRLRVEVRPTVSPEQLASLD